MAENTTTDSTIDIIYPGDEVMATPEVVEETRMADIRVVRPDAEVYEDEDKISRVDTTLGEKHVAFRFDHVEYPEEGGIYVYLKDVLFPVKGIPTPEALSNCNLIKRVFISQVRYFAKHPWTLLPLIRIKTLEDLLREWAEINNMILGPFYLKDIRYSNICRELMKFAQVFLTELGVTGQFRETTTIAYMIARDLATIIEYDDAYRLRLEDLFSVTSKEKMLENPRRELNLMLKTLKERDARMTMNEKFVSIVRILSLALWVPKVRYAFTVALESIDFTKLQMDEADRYHTLRLTTYKFGGIEDDVRFKKYIEMHNHIVPEHYPIN